ncbi:helix-turn-helix domain-containing protein [Halorussus salinisoli]|uniref:helix-turn-helix domain-containing protein n=1 Tax=Halorussus salinisoli TaxID=2558242 RepID=UPI0010C18A9F|nr:helix-turn-helix domain-containing protein [Halorussus salinisoli]
MPHVKLTIDIPETTWIGEISAQNPELIFKVIASMPGEDTGIGLVRLIATDPLPVITDIQAREDVEDLALLWKHEDEALLQIRTSNPILLLPVWRAGVPLTTPFDIENGQAMWESTTSPNSLSRLRTQLEDLGIGFSIEHVRAIDANPADQLMTERQQEVLLTAVREGYYRTPRDATLGDVADVLEIANATCSDTLHRAEGHIVHWFVEEQMDVQPSE